MHNAYRRDKAGRGTFDRVVKAVRLMQRHDVEFNVLCAVHAANSEHALSVYRFLRDELGARYYQFIPIVERADGNGLGLTNANERVTERSVNPDSYGRFLIEIFDEWVRHDVGSIYVQLFGAVLASWVLGQSSLCTFRETCGEAVAVEHNGDLYSCDHFVEPARRLGNILQTPLVDMLNSDRQRAFGAEKRNALPRCCRECPYLFECRGECPKNRFLTAPNGDAGLNYLCAALKAWFGHVDPYMRGMAALLRERRPASEIMSNGQI